MSKANVVSLTMFNIHVLTIKTNFVEITQQLAIKHLTVQILAFYMNWKKEKNLLVNY